MASNSVMEPATRITEAEVRQFIDEWFEKLDVHAPLEDMLPLVADADLVMRLPEVTAYGHKGFTEWYERAINTFFDEIHTIHAMRITPSDQGAKVELILQWEPVVWQPPAPTSKRLGFFAAQTWELRRSPQTQKPYIVEYNVDYFIPMPGLQEL